MKNIINHIKDNPELYSIIAFAVFGILAFLAKAYTYSFLSIYLSFLILLMKKRKKKWDSVSDRLLDFATFVLLGAPALVYLLVVAIDQIIIAYPQYVVVQGEKGDWIGFAGSLIGGALTLIAIIFTFQFEKEKNEKESITKLRPYVVCESILKSKIPTEDNSLRFNLTFKNLGVSPAREFQLQKNESWINVNQESVGKTIFVQKIDFLESSKVITCSCSISHLPIELSDDYHFHLFLDFKYSDLSADHQYKHNVRVDGMLFVDKDRKLKVDIESAGVINEFVWEELKV